MAEIKKRQKLSDNAELMAEWDFEKNKHDGLDPIKLSLNSHVKAHWLCSKGHSFQASIATRNRGSQCPVCLNRVIIPGINDFQTLCPSLAKEWDYDKNEGLLPTAVARSSRKLVWWKCPTGHEYQATINHRVNGTNCPYCASKKVFIGYNDLASKYPELLSEWDYTKNNMHPNEITSKSNLRVWWVCKKCDHSWQTSVSSRVSGGTGCPACAREEIRLRSAAKGSLSEKYPHIAKEWHPSKNGAMSPENYSIGSETKVWWLCSTCRTEWQTAIRKRVDGTGCPTCAKEKFAHTYRKNLIKKSLSLKDQYPQLAAEWHPTKNDNLSPSQFTAGSSKKVWWLCSNGHEWKASIDSRKRGSGCPYCSNKKVLPGYNDLQTTHPHIAKEWNFSKNLNLSPTEVVAGSGKSVWWICEQSHEWENIIAQRSKGSGCPICKKQKRKTNTP